MWFLWIFALIALYGNRAEAQTKLRLCSNNETISIEISSGGVNCQCQTLPQDPTPRDDYIHTPGIGSHKIYTNAKNFNDARKACNQDDAHLAIINSKAEELLLIEMLKGAAKSIRNALNVEEALLGIHDLYQEGEWVTIFGEPLSSTGYGSWSPTYWGGQPDNYGGNQNCGAVINQGGMDDVNCRDNFAYICELPIPC